MRAMYAICGLLAAATLVITGKVVADDSEGAAAHPLAPFERLVGGRWSIEGTYQEFEWGVGRESVKAKSYFVVDGQPMLVSEGLWFWHPGEGQIRGVFTAIEMPVTFFEYTTSFAGDTMRNEIRTFARDGSATSYEETWQFTDDDHYVWALYRKTPEGLVKDMGGTFERSR